MEHCQQLLKGPKIKGVIGAKRKGGSRVMEAPQATNNVLMDTYSSDPTVCTWVTHFPHVSDFPLHAFHVLDIPVLH